MDTDKVVARLDESGRLHNEIVALAPDISRAAEVCTGALRAGGKIIFFGNGGSAADAQHLACELVVRYRLGRRALPAIALTTNTSTMTAAGNDLGFEKIFARQVEALAAPGDVVVAISTSGTSPNVLEAVSAARAGKCAVIALTGARGGRLAEVADLALVVPSDETDRIQEVHITIGHIICELVEESLCGEQGA